MKKFKFKIYCNIYFFISIRIGMYIRWYVIKYTLDDNKKHNKILYKIAIKIKDNLIKFTNWFSNIMMLNATNEFWEQFYEFDRKYFS